MSRDRTGATAGADPRALAAVLAQDAAGFYARGWLLGTSGNFSAVAGRDPLELVITASGADKGRLSDHDFLVIDGDGSPTRPTERHASDEAALHLAVLGARPVGAIYHTHSVWATLASDAGAATGGVWLEGFEMLKGLSGVSTHEHREHLPVLGNSQDYPTLAAEVAAALAREPDAHGFLLRRHGLYTWGRDLDEARRHVEILEFLLEVTGRATDRAREEDRDGSRSHPR